MQSSARSSNGTPLFECACPDCGSVRLLDRRRLGSTCKRCTLVRRNTTHGQRHSKLYALWASMRSRCKFSSMDNYEYYGGRGVGVCDQWADFEVFSAWALGAGYAEGLEIDRLDNDGHYEPGNCRFVTHQVNSQKRSNSRCNLAQARRAKELLSESTSVKDVAAALELPYMTVWHISKGKTWKNA